MDAASSLLTYVKNHVDEGSDRDLTEVSNLCLAVLGKRRYNRHLTQVYNDFFLEAMDIALALPLETKKPRKLRLPDMVMPSPSDLSRKTTETVAISPGDLQRVAAYGTLCEVLHKRTGRFFRYKDEQINLASGGVCTTTVLEISGIPFKG